MSNTVPDHMAIEASLNVSVIIPARNAAETIADTLASLRAQTHTGWEAIVVDDGSSDGTLACVQALGGQDPRIRLLIQEHQGVSAARNAGIRVAHFDWLLFLDADDWLAPHYLERMTHALTGNSDLDAVHCGWVRIAPDGTPMEERYGPDTADLFPVFARHCAFCIHACVVRRSIVEAVGGFDLVLRTCEDWDLWQRIARAGARFGALHETLALYRMRARSASNDGARCLADGLRVITQGHAPDPRVPNPASAYAEGLPWAQLPQARLDFVGWAAGLVLGAGDEARRLLQFLGDDHDPGLDPTRVAAGLFESTLLPTCRTPDAWRELWPHLQPRLHDFLEALEAQSLAPRLAHRVQNRLERMILSHSQQALPLTLGTTHGIYLELTEPIPDLHLRPSIERLQCHIEIEGVRIGMLELPVCDGTVSSYVLGDAIAARFCWPILGYFFERTLYPTLRVEVEAGGLSLYRGSCRLADGLLVQAPLPWLEIHDRVGWAVFLQEIWGCPESPQGWFYQDDLPGHPSATGWRGTLQHAWNYLRPFQLRSTMPKTARQRRQESPWVSIEVSDDLPDIAAHSERFDVLLTVGGVALGLIPVAIQNHRRQAQALRVMLTRESGLELCRAAVREGILGRPMAGDLPPLRSRLAAAAAARRRSHFPTIAAQASDGLTGEDLRLLGCNLSPAASAIVLGRRTSGAIGTSVSRRATLPAAVADECREMAALAGNSVWHVPTASATPERVMYLPELIQQRPSVVTPATSLTRMESVHRVDTATYGRSHFESLFAKQPDPWCYTNGYEQTKYEQTLALLPDHPIDRALELACAEGHFTMQLAPRVGDLVAADISEIALNRTAERCADGANVSYQRLDLTRDPLPGRFDLIVCSEVLYYTADREQLRAVAHKLADALESGGYLLMAHANLVVDDPDRTGFDWDCPFGAKTIGEVLASTRPLQLVKELHTPLYRIQLFQHAGGQRPSSICHTPEVVECAAAPLPTEIAAHVLWKGGCPQTSQVSRRVITDRLPILMYHRVAPTGSGAMARYRVSPEAFEHQLRYLRDAGYYSIDLEDWRMAVATKTPLDGRAVLITFDDGYADFYTYAWPLLQRHGFSATVFLVSEAIGQSNSWDVIYGEKVPLLGETELVQLLNEGVTFGSHAVSHRPLTGLAPAEIVREGIGSRLALERRLGVPIHAFAYPYGDTDQVVQHLIGACGYLFGLSCRHGLSIFDDSLLALPRLEVSGTDGFQDFVVNVGGE